MIQAFHILSGEWRVQSNKLVEHTSEGPNIWFVVVRFILPYLWTCIVWGTGLSLKNACFSHFRNIEVTQFDHTLFCKEYISALDIPMNNLLLMKALQAKNHLVKYGPNVILFREFLSLLSGVDFAL